MEQKEESKKEKDFKFLVIGGTESLSKEVEKLEEMSKSDDKEVLVLSKEELVLIAKFRSHKEQQKEEEKKFVQFFQDEENKKAVEKNAKEIYKKFENYFAGGAFIGLKAMKNETTLSWKDFNQMIGVLDMFGYVVWENDLKRDLKIILSEEEILDNKRKETQQILDLAKGKIIELQGMMKLKKDKDKLDTMKKRMTLSV